VASSATKLLEVLRDIGKAFLIRHAQRPMNIGALVQEVHHIEHRGSAAPRRRRTDRPESARLDANAHLVLAGIQKRPPHFSELSWSPYLNGFVGLHPFSEISLIFVVRCSTKLVFDKGRLCEQSDANLSKSLRARMPEL
jgi:hypothetical protein